MPTRVSVTLVAAAIALAFADASIVVLALPELYGTFEVSIVEVSWVITAYNVAVVVTSVGLLWAQAAPQRVTAVGLAVFAASSLVGGMATSFGVLVGARVAQGAGAACLLVGSLPTLVALSGSTGRARTAWSQAAALGVATGPALGGALTQLLSWRSIFLVQAPVAGLALTGALRGRREHDYDGAGEVDLRAAVADVGFVLLFAALVGALFLSVLLFVVVWDYTPLQSALLVSALAVGTVAVGRLAAALPPWLAALGGGWVLAGGLLGLAWLPASSAAYAAVALAFCGCGFGLLNAVLDRRSLAPTEQRRGPVTLVIGAKHLGLVVGLLAVAPMLAGDIEAATREATRAGTAVLLDAPLELRVKVPLALDLEELVRTTPRGEVPDVREPFDRRGAGTDENVRAVRDELTGAIRATITRSFRSSLLATALLAAAATVVGTAATWLREQA